MGSFDRIRLCERSGGGIPWLKVGLIRRKRFGVFKQDGRGIQLNQGVALQIEAGGRGAGGQLCWVNTMGWGSIHFEGRVRNFRGERSFEVFQALRREGRDGGDQRRTMPPASRDVIHLAKERELLFLRKVSECVVTILRGGQGIQGGE